MTSLVSEEFGVPSGTREARAHDRARRRTVDSLAGHTVWCVGAAGTPARLLWERLQWAAPEGVASARLASLADAEALAGARVRPDDVVVLHQRPAAALARAIRDRGAHAVWHSRSPLDLARDLDAYVLEGRTAEGAHVVAAVMPSAGIVHFKEIRGGAYLDVGWSSLLGDVVRGDRNECVGGTLRPRPLVPVR